MDAPALAAMACLRYSHIVVWLIAADVALANIPKSVVTEVDNYLRLKLENDNRTLESLNFTNVETRRTETKKKSLHRSTSSSSSAARESKSQQAESLSGSSSSSASSSSGGKRDSRIKSTVERHGWRKWHRKCQSCPEDMAKKWRDPTIKWICGAYQRARRSFKSSCMMHYRNCQDGTMFVKVGDHRCKNESAGFDKPRGEHFFYEYKVKLSGSSESSHSDTSDITSSEQSSSSYY